ncbi:MAG: SLBB domain-containing protein [Oscillospiraceae bacterium]|nr:SLBB domain-containing protein [Oscillospiraceae bacterium]
MPMELAKIVCDAGILGAGGAGFPTHVKINCKAEYVLANGAECEPLLRVDQQIMQVYAADVVRGIRAVKEFTGASYAVICLKEHYHDAVHALQEVLKDSDDVQLHLLEGYYPAGDEQQIVYEVTGRVVPTGGLPLDVGTVVCNVSTLVNIANALDGKKVIEKYVTVGGAVRKPVTLRVPVGISLRECLEAAGGATEECDYIIGGPCMGRVVDTLDIPVTKTTGGLLAIPKNHPLLQQKSAEINYQRILSVCCQCSMCTQMCPRNALGLNVQPHKAMRSLANGFDLLGDFNGIFSCCNCGLCTYYACNFGLKPSQVMQTLKSAIGSKGIRPRKEVFGPVDGGLENKKVPVERLIGRLGLSQYDVPAPLNDRLLSTDCVRIALRMGVGAPSVPKVAVGDKVRKNQLIADIEEKKLGVKMHASISGTVTGITGDYIEIRRSSK